MNLERSALRWLFWPVHRGLLRLSGARMGLAEPGRRIGTLLLTTTGRRSGAQRTVPVFFMRDRDRLVLVASNVGDDRDPAWYLNLAAHPEVEARTPRESGRFLARAATDEERGRLWPELIRLNAAFTRYESRTQRPLPVVVLEPVEAI